MRLLGIDAASPAATVVLGEWQDRRVRVVEQSALAPRETAATLVPAVEAMLARAGWEFASVGGVAVIRGPGSFTGVRVGLATAKGLVEAGGVALLAVSSLEVLASQFTGPCCALLDAGRGELYAGLYPWGREALVRVDELQGFADGRPLVAYEAAVLERVPAARAMAAPDASALLRLAGPRIAAGERTDALTLDANYLRRSEAENRFAP